MCYIDKRDIQGKNILEYGCNIGGNCFVAAKFGAKSLLGIDYSPKIISAAIRINAFFSAPATFLVHDLNYPLNELEPADTVFCFSVINHLQNKDTFAETLLKTTKNILYFEGHSKTRLEDYAYVLNNDNFTSIEHVGNMRDGIHNDKRRRPLFRCVIRRAG
jgi:SAM-dependent methyltransferase